MPEQPWPPGDVPLGHAQALTLARKLGPIILLLGTQLFPYGWGHIVSMCQVMEGTWPRGQDHGRGGHSHQHLVALGRSRCLTL